MTGWDRLLDYVTGVALACLAVAVAFCAAEASSWRGRCWAVQSGWTWAARDTTTVHSTATATVRCTSIRQTALRLLRHVVEEL